MNKDNVKPADKLLRLSSKVLLDFETSWALQSNPSQGAYFEYMRERFLLKRFQEAIAKLSHSVIPAMILSGKTKFNVHNLVLNA